VLRGQSSPVDLYNLIGDAGMGPWADRRTRPTDPLVGRAAESKVLRDALASVAASGRGAAILVVGEAGVGKTRLLAALEDDARAAGFTWLWTENVSYGRDEPYRYARLFAQAAADEQNEDSGTFARRLLFPAGTDPEVVRRFGGAIASIARDAVFSGWEAEAVDAPTDPAEVAAVLTEVAGAYLDRLMTTAGPRVVVIDDVQWLDPSSAGMVELMIEATQRHPLLVLAVTRPGDLPVWAERPGVRVLPLGGLAEPETARLATIIARAAVEVEDARRLHERTGGNPLFVSETVRAFLEDGTLQRRDGRVSLADPTDAVVPLTLRAVLGARLDALDPEAREVIDTASVVGLYFGEDDLVALLGRPVAPGVLRRLAGAALVVHVDGPEWRFAHALIHDAAYAGLLASRRRLLHATLADVLDERAEGAPSGLVAAHRAAAGDVERAIPLLRDAAAAALTVGAPAEAADFWRRAASLAASSDPIGAEADRRAAEAAARAAAAMRLASGPGRA
jgi:predicted ATPase